MKRMLVMVTLMVLGMMLIGAGFVKQAQPEVAPYEVLAQGVVIDDAFTGWGAVVLYPGDNQIDVTIKRANVKMVSATPYEAGGCFVEVANVHRAGRADTTFSVLGWCPSEAESTGDVPFTFTAYGYGID